MPQISNPNRCEYCGKWNRESEPGWSVVEVGKSDDGYSQWTERGGYCYDCQKRHNQSDYARSRTGTRSPIRADDV